MYISKAKLILSFSPSSWMGKHLIKEKPAETTTASLYSSSSSPNPLLQVEESGTGSKRSSRCQGSKTLGIPRLDDSFPPFFF